ncbi:ABC-2 transporter permease [Alkalithermobacter paradoxus]|uniref:ABC-2 family transporter protein n=1 Tax=Alkalithermobacter paradoxus TaxID=29349 RepID=A0A1V4I7J0_9FIRM|nr:hypothetical protein CLOTH_10420 [[Clostridium] thermoalcaliphilum]
MTAIKYLILDLMLIRGILKYYILFPLVFILLLKKESAVFALGYIFFILLFIAPSPFTGESKEKDDSFYYILPSKISSIVLGRYLYLLSAIIIIWLIGGTAMFYLYNSNEVNRMELWTICFSGVAATLISFLQYPLYYKFGMEKGRILVLGVPAMAVFILPTLLNNYLPENFLAELVNKYLNNVTNLIAISGAIISIVGFISFKVSCSICKAKEF